MLVHKQYSPLSANCTEYVVVRSNNLNFDRKYQLLPTKMFWKSTRRIYSTIYQYEQWTWVIVFPWSLQLYFELCKKYKNVMVSIASLACLQCGTVGLGYSVYRPLEIGWFLSAMSLVVRFVSSHFLSWSLPWTGMIVRFSKMNWQYWWIKLILWWLAVAYGSLDGLNVWLLI